AVADQAVLCGKGLVIEGRVEQGARKIGAERTTHLHRSHWPAAGGAAADIVDDLTQSQAKAGLEQAREFDVAGELDRHRTARAAVAEFAISIGAVSEDRRHSRQRDNIVDDGWLTKGTLMRRQWRLGADLAPLALEAVEQGCLFAADVRAGAD